MLHSDRQFLQMSSNHHDFNRLDISVYIINDDNLSAKSSISCLHLNFGPFTVFIATIRRNSAKRATDVPVCIWKYYLILVWNVTEITFLAVIVQMFLSVCLEFTF